MVDKTYYIEMPSGRTIPINAESEEQAIEKFKIRYPHKVISYVWDK